MNNERASVNPTDEIIILLRESWGSFQRAAAIYSAQCSIDANFPQKLLDAAPYLSIKIRAALEASRTGDCDWRVAAEIVSHSKRLAKLPAPRQTAVIEHGVDVAVTGGEVLHVPLYAITDQQASRIFCGGRVLTPTEQSISMREPQKKPYKISKKWKISGRNLVVYADTILNYDDLVSILREMSS